MSEGVLSEEEERSSFGPHQDDAIAKAADLADLVLDAPERFANGDGQLEQQSLVAMKSILDFALHTENDSLQAIGKYLDPFLDQVHSTSTRSNGGNKKRKRQGAIAVNPLVDSTPLEVLTIDSINEEQLWAQMELKNAKMAALLDSTMVEVNLVDEKQKLLEEEEEEEEEEEDKFKALDEDEKKNRKKRKRGAGADGDEEDELPAEEVIDSIKQLSDAELRSLGLDPSRRADLVAFDEEDGIGSGSEEGDDEDGGEGYPGASDLSDDDEMQGRIVLEPLRTEEEQRKRQAQLLAEERERARQSMKLRKMIGLESEDDEDEDDGEEVGDEYEEEDDDDDDEGDKDYMNEEDVARSSEESDSDADSADESEGGPAKDRQPSSLLDKLDARGSASSSGRKWMQHPTLDDSFFSIEQFNKDTDDYANEDISLGDDVNLFKAIDGEEGEALLYSDFFAPPPGGEPSRPKILPKGRPSKVIHGDAPRDTVDEILERRPSVRFNDQVAVRRIKARKDREIEITPELLEALQMRQSEDEVEDWEEEEEDGEGDDDEDGKEEDDNEEEEGEEEEERGEDSEDLDEDIEILDRDERDEGMGSEDFPNEDKEDMDRETDLLSDASLEEQETVHRLSGNLFADDTKEEDRSRSSHEKRLEKLQQEIARLEEENVSKKDWTLMGESGTRSRPENSLLAESLDFENNQRAKPVITQETTATLEDMIKKRILESRFDDVERRANLQAFDFIPSKMLELSDSKSGKSLDQVYEDEMGLGNGPTQGEKLDKQLEQDHEEISRLYDELEYKLDALSNAHFTPKAPKATIQTLTNAPTVTMEESLPTSTSYASQLTPEEVYDVGRHNAALEGERSEMTPEEKKRLQRQLRADKKARNARIESVKKNVEINKQAFAQNRGSRFVGATQQRGSRKDAKEKEEALSKLLGNKGVSVVGKGNDEKKQRRKQRPQDGFALNASHLKL